MKGLIVYESPYGATLIYARELQKALNFPLISLSDLEYSSVDQYDIIIVGTFVFSGRIFKSQAINQLMTQHPDPFWILYTVGISTPRLTDFQRLIGEVFTPQACKHLASFHYRGRIATKRFSLMYLASKRMKRQPGTSLDDVVLGPEEWHLVDHHGLTVENEDLKDITNMIEYIREIVQYM